MTFGIRYSYNKYKLKCLYTNIYISNRGFNSQLISSVQGVLFKMYAVLERYELRLERHVTYISGSCSVSKCTTSTLVYVCRFVIVFSSHFSVQKPRGRHHQAEMWVEASLGKKTEVRGNFMQTGTPYMLRSCLSGPSVDVSKYQVP